MPAGTPLSNRDVACLVDDAALSLVRADNLASVPDSVHDRINAMYGNLVLLAEDIRNA